MKKLLVFIGILTFFMACKNEPKTENETHELTEKIEPNSVGELVVREEKVASKPVETNNKSKTKPSKKTEIATKKVAELTYEETSSELLNAIKSKKNTAEYIQKLKEADLEELAMELNTESKKTAFWVNAYNGYVQYYLEENPDAFDNPEFFLSKEIINIGGEELSIDQIETDIFRFTEPAITRGLLDNVFHSDFIKTFRLEERDARIHFVLNNGAEDAPVIPFLNPANLEKELEKRTAAYLKKHTTYDSKENVATTSTLLDWYRKDFGGKNGIADYLKR